MPKIKLCGMMSLQDIETANRLMPDYVGFVFWAKSRRFIRPESASLFIQNMNNAIQAVGVYVDESPEVIANMFRNGLIHLAQLHGNEDESYISALRKMVSVPIIKAFRIRSKADLEAAKRSTAEYILLDAGMGDGQTFDWELLANFDRPYFLAGGLTPQNVTEAIRRLNPFGVDVSSGIETDGKKDKDKMTLFAANVRSAL